MLKIGFIKYRLYQLNIGYVLVKYRFTQISTFSDF